MSHASKRQRKSPLTLQVALWIMGLAAPRKRRKLPSDPNNTAWTRSATSYGAKILTAHGWTPGSYLGVRDAPHAAHYTAASGGHIRVALREENLGLGAGGGRRSDDGKDEGWAIGGLSDLLGRLNGKGDEEIGEEQRARKVLLREREKARYLGQKFGLGRFISAGVLTGTIGRVEESEQKEEKRKWDNGSKVDFEGEMSRDGTYEATRASSDRQEKKTELRVPDGIVELSEQAAKDERRMLRQEKRGRKEASRLKRQQKEANRERRTSLGDSNILTPEIGAAFEAANTITRPSSSIPVAEPNFTGSRQAVRLRYIRHKKMAIMDPQALKEILMEKG